MPKLQIKRGLKVNLPTLSDGELGYCTDTKELYIGSTGGNVLVTGNLNPDNLSKAVTIAKGGTGGTTAADALTNLGALGKTGDASNVTVTFTTATTLATLITGEKISIAFGKIAKAISDFISHLADTTKHITDAERTKWNNKQDALGYTPLNSTLKGVKNGLAELDANGLVPSSQLPSYVDDVLEYSAKASFPTSGETGKIYVDISTNITWRWSGSSYVEISPSIALGETSSTAYRGDRGKIAYDHSQLVSSNPHKVTKSDVGLDNVPNLATNDLIPSYTPASTLAALSSGEKLSIAFGKIAKAITDLVTHLADTAKHTNTTYTAGTGLTLSSTTFNHSNSISSGTAKGSDTKTLGFGDTFTIPTVSYDAQGHVIGSGITTMTMPMANSINTTLYTTVIKGNKPKDRFDVFYNVPISNIQLKMLGYIHGSTVTSITMPVAMIRNSFALVGNKLFVSSGSATDSLVYIDIITNVIKSIKMPASLPWGNNDSFAVAGDKLFVGSSSSSKIIAVVDTLTDTVTSIDMALSWAWGNNNSFALVGNKLFVSGGSGSNTAAYLFYIDVITKTVYNAPAPSLNSWGINGAFALLGNKLFVGTASSLSMYAGFLDLSKNTATSIKLADSGNGGIGAYGSFAVANGKLFVGSNLSGAVVYTIDGTTNAVTSITMPYSGSWGYDDGFILVGNKLFISSGSSTDSTSLSYIDVTTNTVTSITMPYSAMWGCRGAFALVGNKLFVGGYSTTSSQPMAVVNIDTNAVTSITMPTGSSWGYGGALALVGDRLFVGSSTSISSVAVINTNTNAVTSIVMPSNTNWNTFAIAGNKLFISNGSSSTTIVAIS